MDKQTVILICAFSLAVLGLLTMFSIRLALAYIEKLIDEIRGELSYDSREHHQLVASIANDVNDIKNDTDDLKETVNALYHTVEMLNSTVYEIQRAPRTETAEDSSNHTDPRIYSG